MRLPPGATCASRCPGSRSVLEPGRMTGVELSGAAHRRRDRRLGTAAVRRCRPVAVPPRRRGGRPGGAPRRSGGNRRRPGTSRRRWRGDPFPDVDASGDIASADRGGPPHSSPTRRCASASCSSSPGRFDDAAAWAERVKQAAPYDERAHRLAIAAQLAAARPGGRPEPPSRRRGRCSTNSASSRNRGRGCCSARPRSTSGAHGSAA